MSLDKKHTYDVTTRLLKEDEVPVFDIKYNTHINHEYKDDFVDLNAILNFTEKDIDYEIYLKGFHIDDKIIDGGHDIIVIWGMTDKDNKIGDFSEYIQNIARVIINDVIKDFLNTLEESVKFSEKYLSTQTE